MIGSTNRAEQLNYFPTSLSLYGQQEKFIRVKISNLKQDLVSNQYHAEATEFKLYDYYGNEVNRSTFSVSGSPLTYSPFNAVDNNISTYWGFASTYRRDVFTLTSNFTAVQQINNLYLKHIANGQEATVTFFNGSNQVYQTYIANLTEGEYTFSPVTANQVKIDLTNLQGPTVAYGGLYELQAGYKTYSSTGTFYSLPVTTATATDNLTLNVVEDKPAGTSISY